MLFKSHDEESGSRFLAVENIPNRETFIIMDEAKPYKGKFTRGEEASITVKRKKDEATFTFILKEFNLNKIIPCFGEDSKEWVGKEIEITRKYSDKYGKNFLAINIPEREIDIESPF